MPAWENGKGPGGSRRNTLWPSPGDGEGRTATAPAGSPGPGPVPWTWREPCLQPRAGGWGKQQTSAHKLSRRRPELFPHLLSPLALETLPAPGPPAGVLQEQQEDAGRVVSREGVLGQAWAWGEMWATVTDVTSRRLPALQPPKTVHAHQQSKSHIST